MNTTRTATPLSPVEIAIAAPSSTRSAGRALAIAAAVAAVALGGGLPGTALAQAAGPKTVTSSAAVTGLTTFDSDLDGGGGSFRWSGMTASGSLARQMAGLNEVIAG